MQSGQVIGGTRKNLREATNRAAQACTMVFQNYALIDSMTVIEIAFPLSKNTKIQNDIEKLVHDLLEMLDLPGQRLPSALAAA